MAKETIQIKFEPVGDGVLIKAIEKLDEATKSLIKAQASLEKQGGRNRDNQKKNIQALRQLSTKLRALDLNYKKVGISSELLKKAHQGHAVSLQKVRNQVSKFTRSQNDLEVSTRILGGTFAVLRSKLLLAGFAMGVIIRPLGRIVESSTKVESLSRAFTTLSGGANQASVSIEKLEKATDNTMTKTDMFTQANNAMILGVTKNSDEMAEMFDIAQRLGDALGRDTASSVESLITGIGRQSRLMLDNIGIIVKSDEAYKSYAKANKLVASELTDAQKKQAFFNATMESARTKVKNLPPEIRTNQRVFQELRKTLSDLSESIGTAITPLIVDLSKEFITLANATAKGINAVNKFFGLGEEAKTIQEIDLEITHLNQDIIDLQNTVAEQKSKLDFGIFGDAVFTEKVQIKGLQEEVKRLTELRQSLIAQEEAKKDKESPVDSLQIQLDAEKEFAEKRKAIYDEEAMQRMVNEMEIADKAKQGFERLTSEYQKNVERRRDNEIQALQDSLAYEQATAEERKTMEKNVKKEFAKEEKRLFMMKKMSTVAQIVLDTASAMTEALPNVPLSLAIGALGTIQQGIALATPPPKYEQGGLVGGRRHSQGGTMIEAERGEFVMSRSAVESIGTETLNQMNQGGAGGITLNISAPLVDETIIDTIIPAIHKAQKMDLA